MTLRALVVDDEAPARKRLRDLITEEPGIELAGECGDGPAAIKAIRSLAPDVIFLDVQMPAMTGFDVLEAVRPPVNTAVVFVTAYDQHALAAFEARAVDYLLKPFTRARFQETLARLRRADSAELATRLERLLSDRPPERGRIAVKDGGRVRFVAVADIDWLEADGNYVRVHSGPVEHRTRGTLKALANRFRHDGFVRIHQSYAVKLDRVREVRPWSHGELVVVLESGKELVSSRTYTAEVKARLGL